MLLPVIVAALLLFQYHVAGLCFNHACRSFLIFCVIGYSGLITKAFEAFMCQDLVDGTQMLLAAPSVVCWEGSHIVLFIVSIVLLLVYGIGIPVGIGALLAHYRKQDMLKDKVVLERMGFLYVRYEGPFWFWCAHLYRYVY